MRTYIFVEALFYLVYLFIFTGFLFHKSSNPTIGPYSIEHILLLVILAFGFVLPRALRYFVQKYGARKIGIEFLKGFVIFIIIYAFISAVYYNTRFHPFDPYLQMHPADIEPYMFNKPQNTVRVLTLGGSTTQNGGLPEQYRYPNVMLGLLKNAYPEKNIEVFNAGMVWYTSKHSLINYTTNLREWKPDIAILMHGLNDIMRSCVGNNQTVGEYNRLWSNFYGPSYAGVKPYTIEKRIFDIFSNIWFSSIKNSEVDVAPEKFLSLIDYERNLKTLVHVLKLDGVKVILMTEANRYEEGLDGQEESLSKFSKGSCMKKERFMKYTYPSLQSIIEITRAFNNRSIEVAIQEGVIYADPESLIPKNETYFADEMHYTKLGASMLAHIAADTIISENLITQE